VGDSEARPLARARFTFEGLDSIERRLRRVGTDASHVMVWDRTERAAEENLGRFDLTPGDALPYLEAGWTPDHIDDAVSIDDPTDDEPVDTELADAMDEDDHDEPEERIDDAPSTAVARRDPRTVTQAQIAEAACRWLRDIAARNTLAEPYRRFRVKIYGPKGLRTLDTGSFVCRNDDHDLDIPVPAQNSPLTEKTRPHDREIPPPSFETVEITSAGRGMRALGDYYAQWGRIVLGSVHQLQGVNNAMVHKLHTQLDASRDQVDELVGAILNLRAAEMEIAEKQRSSDKTEDTRAEIAKHALQQLGDAAKAFLAARGVTPEMADVLGTLGQSPDLMATLNDPDVRILMQDGNNLKLLAGLLKQAAEQSRAAREASTQAA
jgi:hypothetical protein